ncbi:MAG: phosphoglycerate kinase [Leptospirales bacterium]|nr:phosphoglycerate kinase [Leptospirales bacterium]
MVFARLENANVADQRVLLRADLESAIDSSGRIVSEAPLQALRGAVELLLARGAAPIILAHAGKVEDPNSGSISLAPAAESLTQILGRPVRYAPLSSAQARPGEVVLLENLLIHSGEAKCDAAFARQLAELGDLYVNDAFGVCRKKLASITALPRLLPRFAGPALYQEYSTLGALLSRDRKPLVIIVGGMRLERKIKMLARIMEKADEVHVGGGIAATFLKSRALPVGASFVERDLEVGAFQLIEKSELADTEFFLPQDFVVADRFARDARTKVCAANQIPDRWMALDIGPKTASRMEKSIKSAGATLWIGPLGAVELEPFQKGTRAIGQAMAKARGLRVAVGALTAASMSAWKLDRSVDLVSLDSDTVLDFLSGVTLPGLAALAPAAEDDAE